MNNEKSTYTIVRNEYILAGIIYGTIGLILHYVSLPSDIVVICRGVIGSAFIYLFIRFKGNQLNKDGIKKNILDLFWSGAGLGLNWVFLFASYRYTSVAIGTLCNYLGPIIVILLSPVLYKEKLNAKKLACVGSALLGIILISGLVDGKATDASLLGIGLGILSAVCFVINVVFSRRLKEIGNYDKAVSQLVISALVALPYSLIANLGSKLEIDLRSVILIAMLGIIHTGVAYCFYFRAMAELPIQTFSLLGYIEPVVAILISAIFLKEELTIFGIVGAILILGAVFASDRLNAK